MEAADVLTRVTIWTALLAYAVGEIGRGGLWATLDDARSRLVWSLGCLLYVAHVVVAFQFHHDWSHATAYDATAAETSASVGLDWGGGIFVNYAFTLFWTAEAGSWWFAPTAYRARPTWRWCATRGIFLFMIVNGAVIFVNGPMRWVGLLIVAALLGTWGLNLSRRPPRAAAGPLHRAP